ncbi:ABC transporter substrate-binding protein [Muricauda sp. SCSIO 64092]|uniref:ABC transporter substrate-binding protein n=1 Tax=Allomuricauda sp. SCSIO 64092 TaxID=2908842 RepID=UPI001FF6E700|nr:ABC transporter substrate-binding protein [Muricauda sp. SCSIO 64092]UOY07007.1 ABC transporter substrate-binding protein [Muricauda sp. SCSIO 64092]
MIKTRILPLLLLGLVISCKKNVRPVKQVQVPDTTTSYAKSFSMESSDGFTVLQVNRPWPGASKAFRYLVVPKEKLATMTFPSDAYDAVIATPITSLIATSTTHIPALESLGGLDKLIGFPDTKYISSMPARELISTGKIKELGTNESLNTEMVLELRPDVIIGFGINDQNSAYHVFQKANIPVVFNGDWTEETPLGKAEWIKFFGVLLDKQKEADSIFRAIETSYQEMKKIAAKAAKKPTVLSGALFKDVWYLPAGESWAAQFIKDANGEYLYQATSGTGSLSLSLESVLEKGQQANVWIAPSRFTSYQEMEQANAHYQQFKAFKAKKIYTFANTRGATGGLLYYELAPQRPDLVLQDLVHFFHPEVLPDHNPYFFTPLQ